jgi:hypothetical protein
MAAMGAKLSIVIAFVNVHFRSSSFQKRAGRNPPDPASGEA